MPTWEFVSGGLTSFGTVAVTRYHPLSGSPGADPTESLTQTKIYSSYTWTNLYVVCTNASGGDFTVRSRIGAAFGNMIITITTTTGIFQDTVNTDSLVDGSLIDFEVKKLVNGTHTIPLIGSTLQDTATNTTLQIAKAQEIAAFAIAFGLTRFTGIGGLLCNTGTPGMSTTEAPVQLTIRRATTYSNMRIALETNSLDAATTWSFRVDLANGAQTISIGAGLTGTFEDTTNSDVVAVASEVNYQIDTTASTLGSFRAVLAQLKHISVGREMANMRSVATARTSDGYWPPEGNAVASATEADEQVAARAAFTGKNLFVYVTAHVAGGTGTDVSLRIDGVNSALTVNVPSAATGVFENTTNQVSVAVGVKYNYFGDISAGGGSWTPTIIGMEQGPDDAIYDLPQGKLNVLLRL